ncbi:MAG: hypothetical protein L6R38_006140 [Xanthoria sp. 2 TBL-2021]|nr:MAG: hypothetical protein L6R38_006140 [Xanthoria sp. 2 TBL-2021]
MYRPIITAVSFLLIPQVPFTFAIPLDTSPPLEKAIVPVQPIPTYIPPSPPIKAPVTKIFSSDGNGFENLHVRSNGHILATTAFPSALLFDIDPFHRTGVLLAPDVFYTLGKVRNGTGFSIVSVDMRPFAVYPNGTVCTPPIINEIGTARDGLAMNGMTHLRRNDGFVLITDSLVSGVWKFDINNGKYELIIKDASMTRPANRTEFAAFGINGLRLRPNATSAGPAKHITSNVACDDFALDPRGIIAYVASPRNALIRLDTRTGVQLVVAGTFNESSSDILSASSAHFGAGYHGRGSVYVTTNGGAFVGAPKGSQGVSRVDVEGFVERGYDNW